MQLKMGAKRREDNLPAIISASADEISVVIAESHVGYMSRMSLVLLISSLQTDIRYACVSHHQHEHRVRPPPMSG